MEQSKLPVSKCHDSKKFILELRYNNEASLATGSYAPVETSAKSKPAAEVEPA